jgi:hypothetical protein
MDYDLSRLNHRTFEHLVQGVAASALGPGLVVFGDGPDGGREASLDAKVPYPTEKENWEGRIVLQAKFLQRPKSTSADGDWAIEQLKAELDSYAKPDGGRDLPDYLIFATNATLSAVKDSGAKDRIFELAEETELKGFDVWDYDKLRVFLDENEELRRSFAAYILPGDVLSETIDALAAIRDEQPDFDDSIARFLAKELLADQWANLEQAGRAADEQVPISRVFVDLPFAFERQPDPPFEDPDQLGPGIVSHVVEAASQRLDPASLQERTDRAGSHDVDVADPGEGRLVLLGGPGQGKSTVGQFVCQMFRAALLRSRPPETLSAEVTDALGTLEAHCNADSLELPGVRRFPLRVELNRFAEELGATDGADSLLGYLAKMISARIPGEVTPSQMVSWLAAYPWLLVLDGLDEVPASGNRDQLMTAIREFWVDTSHVNADCLVIATTRPQGYSDQFSPRHYRHLWLAPLSTSRAMHYARRLLNARVPGDSERREKIAERVARAAARPDTARLMTSPLQVTIMATLLERMGQPPEGRWNLFSQYYRVIYDRELERDIPAASVLRDYKPDIDAIHRRVGLLLQVESESAEGVEAQISRARFSEIVIERLREEGHDPEGDDLVAQIIDTAMERLVFLVGLEADQVGFEIRSLQEFMAAEALLDGGQEIIERRLRAIAALPAWRNVFLFAAGRCFADLQWLRASVPAICAGLNDPATDPLAPLALPGSSLAIDLLADGVANRQPRYQRLLGREALRILRRPAGDLDDQLAEVYAPVHRENFEQELAEALAFESFPAALAALRTLAVLAARSHEEEWAFGLFRSRLPDPSQLSELLHALPAAARSEELASLLAEHCAAAPPLQTLPYRHRVEELGVLDFAPRWYQAVFHLAGEAGSKERKLGFEEAPSGELVANLRSVSEPDGPLDRALHTVSLGESGVPGGPWQAFSSAIAFARDPTPSELATQLENLAGAEDEAEIRRYASEMPWPLAALLHSVSELTDLLPYAEAAGEGRFGDLEAWLEAEERWQRVSVTNADLATLAEGEPPFDSRVAAIGFPLNAATITASEDRRAAARVALGWLGVVGDRKTREFITHVIFWLLSVESAQGDGKRLSGTELAAAVGEEDLRADLGLSPEALEEIQWSNPLSPPETALLNGLGCRYRYPFYGSSSVIGPALAESMRAAWVRDPELHGLYRLLATGLPLGAFEGAEAEELLCPDFEEPLATARALLELKLTLGLSDEALTTLASAPDPLLGNALFFIGQLPDAGTHASILARLDSALGSGAWRHRARLGDQATQLIAKRSSPLADEQTWASFELFKRPSPA